MTDSQGYVVRATVGDNEYGVFATEKDARKRADALLREAADKRALYGRYDFGDEAPTSVEIVSIQDDGPQVVATLPEEDS